MNRKVEAWLEDSSSDSEVYQCALEYKKLEVAVQEAIAYIAGDGTIKSVRVLAILAAVDTEIKS